MYIINYYRKNISINIITSVATRTPFEVLETSVGGAFTIYAG